MTAARPTRRRTTSRSSRLPFVLVALVVAAASWLPTLVDGSPILTPRQSLPTNASATNALSANTVQLIKEVLNSTATKSWEIGTHLEALTEYDYPAQAVFFDTYMPVPAQPYAYPVMSIVRSVVANKSANSLQLITDGSAADPASIGVATILANYSIEPDTNRSLYANAASQQLLALLTDTPKTNDGALSHRADELALWSDFVYMVPPFLAYYGTINNNVTLIQAAYDQCRLYRQYLRTPETGLWRHILFGSNPDPGLWATGNGWAAAGMMRVYGSIVNSDYADQFKSQMGDLAAWTVEIVEAAFKLQSSNLLFHNYLNQTNDFVDAASTCLLTSVSYRLAHLGVSTSTLAQAEATRLALHSRISTSTGLLSPVVDPMSYGQPGSTSPEGQAFILLMEAAWADYYAMSDTPSSTGASNTESSWAAPKYGRIETCLTCLLAVGVAFATFL